MAVTAPRTYGQITLTEGRWLIEALEPHVAIRLKQIFPRVPKQSPGPFMLAHDHATDADVLWFLQRYPLRISDSDLAVMQGGQQSFLALQAEMERILLPSHEASTYVGLQLGQIVRPYQVQAIEVAARSRGLLLGDECGLGKTYTAAAFCLAPERLPAAIVCQVHIQRQWVGVLKAFTTLRVHAIMKAKPYDLPPADVYVFRYSQIMGWADIFGQAFFRSAIYDEPQELRGGADTAKGRAAAVLSDRASWRLGLTATPIYNYGREIYEIMQFINRDVLGPREDFCREWSPSGGLINARALGTFLREQYVFLRRTKRDVGKEMPPVNRIVDTVSHDDAAIKSVEDLARQLAIKATTGSFIERGSAARDLDIMVRQATGIAKAPYVADFVRILVESGEPVLLLGWHRAVYDIWLEKFTGLDPVMYTGTESPAQKARAKDDFTSGRTDLMIMSLRSAAGLDGLQFRCSTIVFGELDWSPGIHHQCIERIDRDGQEKPVMAIFLVTDEGSDPPMMEVLGLKASEAHQVIDPHLGVQAVESDQARLHSLVSRYLDKRTAAALRAPMLELEATDA